MKLYHYSTQLYPALLTKRKQKSVDNYDIRLEETRAKELHEPGPYFDHISFFFEPLPITELPKLFSYKHPFYKVGAKVYEYEIDSRTLPPNVLWSLVETPELDKFTDKFDWSVKDKSVRSQYIREMNDYMVAEGFTARGVTELEHKAKPYLGKALEFFKIARSKPDHAETLEQYAAGVPHVMIYPFTGRVDYQSVKPVILGRQAKMTNHSQLYHISFDQGLPSVLKPKQPNGADATGGKYNEVLVDRVSFSPSIQQCFSACYPNIAKLFEDHPNEATVTMAVYVINTNKPLTTLSQEDVVNSVWDAYITGEVCFIEPVPIVKAALIDIDNPYYKGNKPKDIFIQPFNNRHAKPRLLSPEITFSVRERFKNVKLI